MTERIKKLKPKIPPHLRDLAEGEIAIAFVEQPQLVAEARNKVADVLGQREAKQLIDSKTALEYLKKNLGLEVAAVMCSIEEKDYNTYTKKEPPKKLSSLQMRNIGAAYLITEILLSQFSAGDTVDWLTTYNDYLYGFPVVEIRTRPEDVRMAALHRISGGA